jgi:hypothetical protein
MKTILGVLLIAALIFIFLQNLCRKPLPPNPASRAAYEELKKRFDDTTLYLAQALKEERERRERDSVTRLQLQTQFNQSQNKLNASQAAIHRLAAKVEGAKLEMSDTAFYRVIPVSPDYVSACDSLKDMALAQQETIDQQQDDGVKLTEHMMGEIAWRDSAIEAKNEFNRKFSNQLEDCMTQLQAKVNQKQRNQVYAGIGIFGNKINPLAGGQVNVSLKTRGNQIYELTGATVGNTWYAGIGTKFLITFKR